MEKYSGKILSPSGHLTQEAMLRYHSQPMTHDEQYAIEKHSGGCRLCAEALEGAEKIRKETQLNKILDELRRSVRKRIRIPKHITSFNQYVVVAAVIFLLLFLLIIYFVFFKSGIVR